MPDMMKNLKKAEDILKANSTRKKKQLETPGKTQTELKCIHMT